MNIEEQLPGFVLADLYSKSLVLIDNELKKKVPDSDVKKVAKKYLGDYKNKIVVLVNDSDEFYLNEKEYNFLSGILTACKIDIAEIALINFIKNDLSFPSLKTMQPEFLLLFGVTALQIQLPFTMPDYQVQQYNGCQIITAPSLNELNKQTPEAKTEKGKLWKSLQKMFNLEK